MTRFTNFIINCDIELKVREYTMVNTRSKEDDEESVVSCNHITTFDNNSLGEEEDVEDTPPKFEEGVKATVDDLKEINFDISKDPHLIYVSFIKS